MYHEHFGLSGPPFQFTPTPDAIFLGKEHREGLALLEWGITSEPSGLTVLMGETGTGKTTLIFAVLAQHYANIRAAYIGNPKFDFEHMMRTALEQLGFEATGRSKHDLVEALAASLGRLNPGERVALLFDEAQELSNETLEEVRLLSNIDTSAERRLQILLVGQPELGERLSHPRARSLDGRIGARAVLNPLDPAQSRAYVEHRVSLKGGNAGSIFAPRALSYLLAQSRGLPRRINVLCHNAMLLAYGEGQTRVELANAKEAVSAYEDFFKVAKQARRERFPSWALPTARFVGPLIGLAALGIAIGGIFVHAMDYSRTSPRTALSATRDEARNVVTVAPPQPEVAPVNSAPADTPVLFSTPPAKIAAKADDKPVGSPKQNEPVSTLRRIQVRYGDTLSGIAARYLGSPYEINRVLAANPRLKDADRIYPGEIIRLPDADTAEAER